MMKLVPFSEKRGSGTFERRRKAGCYGETIIGVGEGFRPNGENRRHLVRGGKAGVGLPLAGEDKGKRGQDLEKFNVTQRKKKGDSGVRG